MPTPDETSPTIIGDSVLTADQLTAWWSRAPRPQPAGLDTTVAELARLYLSEAETEDVRGDLAFAHAVYESGYFTNADTAINNFAGIAHPDGASAGQAYPDVETGVRAHVQLLKKFAAGNEVQLTAPDVAPRAAAHASTWPELAGSWATDPHYWTSLSQLYDQMRDSAELSQLTGAEPNNCAIEPEADQARALRSDAGSPPELTTVRGITVATSMADKLEELLAAAEADGLLLNGHGYRSHEEQIELRRAHCGTSNYAIYEMPARDCSPPTARPGASLHEVGFAIDFTNCSSRATACWQWLNAHAATYGLFNLASEPWHWSSSGA